MARSCFFILITAGLLLTACRPGHDEMGRIMTVGGELAADQLGKTLIHEHVATDFIGAEQVRQPQYEQSLGIETVLPHLLKLKELGFATLVECTPNYIGRDVRLLAELSSLSGMQILTNTGYYAAVDKKYLPRHAYEENADALAARWLKEWTEGIEGTQIRPGFIKLGVDKGPLDSIEAKLLLAGIQVSKASGLPIYVHTGDGAAARSEYELLLQEGLPPDHLIWVHAQNGTDEERIALARKGVWISLDGVNADRMDRYLAMIQVLREQHLLSKVLISHDDGWSVERDSTGQVRLDVFGFGNEQPYTAITEKLLPGLEAAGYNKAELDSLLIINPRLALTLRKR